MTVPSSILSGINELADEWLQLDFKARKPLYQHHTACRKVCGRESIPSAKDFLEASYRQIDINFHRAKEAGYFNPSKSNWRFEGRSTISVDNASQEVKLERSIVRVASDYWANQIPTSSGLIGPHADKARNIDLVQRLGANHFSFIELKVASNNPLFAAIEILTYGLLFSWSKAEAYDLGYQISEQPIIAAESVDLCVLAPKRYYHGLTIGVLEEAINKGLDSCTQMLGLPFSFSFTHFPEAFSLNDTDSLLLKSAIERVPVK